jgi:hypothetical protein
VLGGGVGFGPWPVVVVLTAAGMVAFWRAGFPAVGLVLPLVALELVVAGAIRLFPFAEARTSLFAIGLVALLAGTGAGTAAVQLLRRGWIAPLGVAVGLTVLALLISAAVRASPGRVPRELIPQQLAHIQAERRPGDIVLISANASWQFAYYAPDRPTFVTTSRRWTAMHFTVTYPERSDLIVVDGLDAVAIRRALAIAAARARRIWIVLGHSEPGRGEEAILDKEARSIGRVTRAPTRIVEPFRRRRLELQRPWLVEVTASVAP